MAGPPQPAVPEHRFGGYEFDSRAGELNQNGSKVRLQGQPVQVLGLLLGRPGEVVTRQELRQELWPAGTYVDFEQGINAAVKRLREALQDSATTPRFIETLPRRGYRFIHPVGKPLLDAVPPGQRVGHQSGIPAGPENAIKIGDVAGHFGISAGLLRLYEREGLLIPLRYRGPRRYFTDQDYRWIDTLLHLVRKDRLNFAGIRRLLALLPCWQIRGCEHHRKQGCPFIKNTLEPCWTNKRACCADGQSCYSCAVYRSAPECENLKRLLAHSVIRKEPLESPHSLVIRGPRRRMKHALGGAISAVP
jgi:DNA-binding winged helix-turn-helix (wHTH) protein/DNA-binding transcriptional MerR regulator